MTQYKLGIIPFDAVATVQRELADAEAALSKAEHQSTLPVSISAPVAEPADVPANEARYRQMQAGQVELPYAEAKLARLTKLHSSNAVSDQDFSDANYKVEELKLQSKGDNAEVQRIRLRQAEEDLVRLTKAHSSNAVSDQDYEQTKLKVELLRARLAPVPVPSQTTNHEREPR